MTLLAAFSALYYAASPVYAYAAWAIATAPLDESYPQLGN